MITEREKAKQVICEILAAAGGHMDGKVRLFKAFYMAHLFYFLRTGGEILTDHPIVKMPYGPGIDEGDLLIDELRKESRIRTTTRMNGPYKEAVFELQARIEIDPKGPRAESIRESVSWVSDKNVTTLSEESHLVSRSWNLAQMGDVLDIYIDPLDDDEYTRMREVEDKIDLADAQEALKGSDFVPLTDVTDSATPR